MKIYITINTRFEGFHRWRDAPEEVAFLRNRHRHIFHVKATKRVDHHDRDTEFILMKREMDKFIATRQKLELVESWSCERWALELAEEFHLAECEVSEDGENGARVVAEETA